MLDNISPRSRDGRVFSAMQGMTSEIDDNDVDMCDAIRGEADAGRVNIHEEEPEPVPVEPVPEPEPWAVPVVEEVEAVPVAYTSYTDRTVAELREAARSRNLPVGGSKDDLIA